MACLKCAQARSAALEAARQAAQGNFNGAKNSAKQSALLVAEKMRQGRISRLGR